MEAEIERAELAPGLACVRILNGLWQVSGAHGTIDARKAVPQMLAYHAAGLTTWDLADHYGPAEDFIGAFRAMLAAQDGETALAESLAFTKWVPRPGQASGALAREAVERSLKRMGVARLDMLQFHWWDYADKGYLAALGYLNELREQGLIRSLALTNFDTERLAEILDAGIPIVSNQVQYSLIDLRPAIAMQALCLDRGVQLLTYGTLCGGLLSERYLGQGEPGRGALSTASLRKYKQMIDLWGGWAQFQRLLLALKAVADRYGASIANVAVRVILDRPAVAGVILGARLGVAEHIAENLQTFSLRLDDADRAQLDEAVAGAADLFRIIGDCGDEYRS
jgi:aryl-alcohol dehydrogenase-like predicted oxidoreductase